MTIDHDDHTVPLGGGGWGVRDIYLSRHLPALPTRARLTIAHNSVIISLLALRGITTIIVL